MKRLSNTPRTWRSTVPPASAKGRRAGATPSDGAARRTIRQRTNAALVDSSTLESVLDRILVNRLRPLRADATAARKAFEAQVTLRVEAESRALRLEAEAQTLRVRVQELEQALAAGEQRRNWFRRRGVMERLQEA